MNIYWDTSVFGGCFDDEYLVWSQKLVHDLVAGKHTVFLSDIVLAELVEAPASVRAVLKKLPEKNIEMISLDAECRTLANAYDEPRPCRQFSQPGNPR